jgi:cob(I)alamin adenosyltransferase
MKHLSFVCSNETKEKVKEMEIRQEQSMELMKYKEEIVQWKDSCEYIRNQCDMLTRQLNVLDSNCVEVNQIKIKLEGEKTSLMQQLREKSEHLELATQLTNQLQVKADQGQIHLNTLNEKNILIQELESQKEYNLGKIRLLEQNISQTSQMLQCKELLLNQVEKECFNSKQMAMQQECSIKELSFTLSQNAFKVLHLQEENNKLEIKLKDCIAQLGTLLIEVQESRDKQGILSCRNEEFTQLLEDKNSSLLQMELKMEKTKTKLRTTEQTILNLSKEKDQLLMEVDDLRLARVLLDECKKRNEKLNGEVSHLMRLLDNKKDEDQIKRFQQELMDMENKIKSLEEERDEYLGENQVEKIEELTRQLNRKVKPILKFKSSEEPL